MTTGFEIQTWNTCLRKAKENGLEIEIKGDKFRVYYDKFTFIGLLDTVQEVFAFLCGYENGIMINERYPKKG